MKNLSIKIYLRNIMFLVLFQSTFVFSQTDNLIGKSYTALISTSCEEFINGGCTIQSYCTLKFSKKTVDITYFNERFCSPKDFEKLYEENTKQNKEALLWSKQNSKIIIEGFNDFGNLYLANENIMFGTTESDGSVKELKFIKMEK
jgi:hypothetical protein